MKSFVFILDKNVYFFIKDNGREEKILEIHSEAGGKYEFRKDNFEQLFFLNGRLTSETENFLLSAEKPVIRFYAYGKVSRVKLPNYRKTMERWQKKLFLNSKYRLDIGKAYLQQKMLELSGALGAYIKRMKVDRHVKKMVLGEVMKNVTDYNNEMHLGIDFDMERCLQLNEKINQMFFTSFSFFYELPQELKPLLKQINLKGNLAERKIYNDFYWRTYNVFATLLMTKLIEKGYDLNISFLGNFKSKKIRGLSYPLIEDLMWLVSGKLRMFVAYVINYSFFDLNDFYIWKNRDGKKIDVLLRYYSLKVFWRLFSEIILHSPHNPLQSILDFLDDAMARKLDWQNNN